MARVSAHAIKRAIGGGAGVWRDDLAKELDGAVTSEGDAEVAEADDATGIANNADDPEPVVTVAEYNALVASFNAMRSALQDAGIIVADE